MPYSIQKRKEIIDYVQKNGIKNAIDYFKIKESTILREIRREKEHNLEYFDFERTDEKNNVSLSLKSHELKTVDEILTYAKIDTTIWEPTKVITNSWGSETNPCYQIKVWLKRKEEEKELNIDEICEDIIERISKYSSPSIIKRTKNDKEKYMLEIGLVDHHLAQLSWGPEVGKDYDIKIGKLLYEKATDSILSSAKNYNIELILYHFGQDFYNVDGIFNTTTKGTVQDEDSRWKKSFDIGVQIHIDAINKLKQIANVQAICIPGNHDTQRMYYAAAVVKAWFKNDKNVEIDNTPPVRKYYKYGKNLLGFTHGEKEKIDRLLGIMPIEAKEYWSKCTNYTWRLGHLHSDHLKQLIMEKNGIKIKHLPTLIPSDAWHFEHGYLHNRETQAFIWHKDRGNIIQINYRV